MKPFAAVTFLLALATASPVEVHPRDEGGALAKRDTEIIYLTNCISAVSCCSDPVHYSQIAVSLFQTWYSNHWPSTDSSPTVLCGQRLVPERRVPRCEQLVLRHQHQLRLVGAGQQPLQLLHRCYCHHPPRLGRWELSPVLVVRVSHH